MRTLIIALLIGLVAGCGGSGGTDDQFSSGALSVISPPAGLPALSIAAVTIEVDGAGLQTLRATHLGETYTGHRTGGLFYVFNVVLQEGANVIALRGTTPSGEERLGEVEVTAGVQPTSNVSFALTPQAADSVPLEAEFTISADTPGTPQEVLIDVDGDGIIDSIQPFNKNIPITIATVARFKPSITVRTDQNLLLGSVPSESPAIVILPPSVPDPALAVPINDAVDAMVHQVSSEVIFLLSSATATVRRLNLETGIIQSISLPGTNGPRDIAVDIEGNLFVADTGNNRILKLLAATGYQPDPLISPNGAFGSGLGQLSAPESVAVFGTGQSQFILVADTGNSRVLRFNRAGVLESELVGGSSNLMTPTDLEVGSGGGVIIVDSSSNSIQRFSQEGNALASLSMGFFPVGPLRVTTATAFGGYVVSDEGAGAIHFVDRAGVLLRTFSQATTSPRAAVAVRREAGVFIYAATTAGLSVQVVPVIEDPPGATPMDVVQNFIAAIVALDFQSACLMIREDRQELFLNHVNSPLNAASVQTDASATANLSLIAQTSSSSFVTGTRTTNSGTTPVEFVLIRSTTNGGWILSEF